MQSQERVCRAATLEAAGRSHRGLLKATAAAGTLSWHRSVTHPLSGIGRTGTGADGHAPLSLPLEAPKRASSAQKKSEELWKLQPGIPDETPQPSTRPGE